MLTAGFRWAPEILPMNRMIPITIRRRGHDGGLSADGPRKRMAHHAAAGRHEHEEERAEELGEQPPPLLAGIVEVLDPPDRRSLVAGDEAGVVGAGGGGVGVDGHGCASSPVGRTTAPTGEGRPRRARARGAHIVHRIRSGPVTHRPMWMMSPRRVLPPIELASRPPGGRHVVGRQLDRAVAASRRRRPTGRAGRGAWRGRSTPPRPSSGPRRSGRCNRSARRQGARSVRRPPTRRPASR